MYWTLINLAHYVHFKMYIVSMYSVGYRSVRTGMHTIGTGKHR